MLSCKAISSPKNVFYPVYDKVIIPTIINVLHIVSMVALYFLSLEKFIFAVLIRLVFYLLNIHGFYQALVEAKIVEQVQNKKIDRIVIILIAIFFEPLLPALFVFIVDYYNKQTIISSDYLQIPDDNDNDNDNDTDNVDVNDNGNNTQNTQTLSPIIHWKGASDDESGDELFEFDIKNKLNDHIEWINDKILMNKIDINNHVYFWMISSQFEFVFNLLFCCYYTSVDLQYGYIHLDHTLYTESYNNFLFWIPLIYFIVSTIFSIKVLFYWISDMFRNCYHLHRMLLLLPTEYFLLVIIILFDITTSFCIFSFYDQNKFNSYWNYLYSPVYSAQFIVIYLLFYWLCIHIPFVLWIDRNDVIDYIKNHTTYSVLISFITIIMTGLCAWTLYWTLFGTSLSFFVFVFMILSNQYKMKISHDRHESFRKIFNNFSNFLLNGKSSKDASLRLISIKSILHSSGMVQNKATYDSFVHFTINHWLSPSDLEKEDNMKINKFINKPLSNMQRLKDTLQCFHNLGKNIWASMKLDFGDVVSYSALCFVGIFVALFCFVILCKVTIIPYILILWSLNMDSGIDYILWSIFVILLLTMISLITIVYNQRKLINYIVLENENWNGLNYDQHKELNQINKINANIQERYESLINYKEIRFILQEFFIQEIANIIWIYCCGERLTYKEENDVEIEFKEASLPFAVRRSTGNGLFVSHRISQDFCDKIVIGSQIIAANNHNLEYKSFQEAHDYVTKRIRLPITMIFRPPY